MTPHDRFPPPPADRGFASLRSRPPSSRGARLVVGLVLLGLAAAATGIWFQRQQTRLCLGFYGGAASRRISAAPQVELWTLRPGGAAGRLTAIERRDVSTARGLVHLRRGLVEDANFFWPDVAPAAAAERLPDGDWTFALSFTDPRDPAAATIVAFAFGRAAPDADQRGAVTVVGQPGRITMGRIETGLGRWIAATLRDGSAVDWSPQAGPSAAGQRPPQRPFSGL